MKRRSMLALTVFLAFNSYYSIGAGTNTGVNEKELNTNLSKTQRHEYYRSVDGEVYNFAKIVDADKKRLLIYKEVKEQDKSKKADVAWQKSKNEMYNECERLYEQTKPYNVIGIVVDNIKEGLIIADRRSENIVLVKDWKYQNETNHYHPIVRFPNCMARS